MLKVKRLKVDKRRLKNFPIFYRYIYFHGFMEPDPDVISEISYQYNDKLGCYSDFHKPEKYISKILDYSKYND